MGDTALPRTLWYIRLILPSMGAQRSMFMPCSGLVESLSLGVVGRSPMPCFHSLCAHLTGPCWWGELIYLQCLQEASSLAELSPRVRCLVGVA